jgi:hypothetical protein
MKVWLTELLDTEGKSYSDREFVNMTAHTRVEVEHWIEDHVAAGLRMCRGSFPSKSRYRPIEVEVPE